FGPSAASFYRDRRHTEKAELNAFLADPEGLVSRIMAEEALTETDETTEEILLSLRLNSGLSLAEILPRLPDASSFLAEAQTLKQADFCRVENDRLSLTEDGFFVSNEIIARLLNAAGL
ncbi:MAG: hypothetical protein II328_03175, partial [Clostridia bacterium]|nr:hypothetical protein [Clostridia bacterium]